MANNTVPYGFIGLQHLYDTRVQQAGAQLILDAVNQSAAEYSRISDSLLSMFASRTTVAQEEFALPGSGTLQPLDEWGNPVPTKVSGSYTVAYPIQGAGDAFGDNRISRNLITVGEVARLTTEIMRKDKDWLMRHMLGAIFDNTTWTYADKVGQNGAKGLGNLTIQPLANGDSVVYNRIGGTVAATDDHYLAQSAGIDDTHNPFSSIKTELTEHPGNTGELVAYVASDLVDSIAALTEFVEVGTSGIQLGANSDTLTMNPQSMVGFGREVIGKTKSGVWIVDTPVIPSSYMVTICTGTDAPFRMREYDSPALQGLFTETFSEDGNKFITRMLRYAGFGCRNRVGAHVTYIGSGSYAIPTGYSTPLPV